MMRSSPHRNADASRQAATSRRSQIACSPIRPKRAGSAMPRSTARRSLAALSARRPNSSKRCWRAMREPEFWTRNDAGAQTLRTLMCPLSWAYGASVAWKARHAMPYRARAKVICVGNLTVGGTGKTPVAIAIAQALIARGNKPAFVSRGYGGKQRGPLEVNPYKDRAADVGDEPLLLALTAPTFIARD